MKVEALVVRLALLGVAASAGCEAIDNFDPFHIVGQQRPATRVFLPIYRRPTSRFVISLRLT